MTFFSLLLKTDEGPSWANYLLLIALGPGLLIFVYHYLKAEWWGRKFLPTQKGKNSVAFMNAYISAAVLMIRLDRRDYDEKRSLLHNKMLELNQDPKILWETFDQIWQNEISENRIAKWSVKHLNADERGELIYLLVELALIDSSLLAREYQFLVKLMKAMKLPLRDLKGMIASHQQRMAREEAEAHQKEREKRRKHKKSGTFRETRSSQTARECALEILGLNKGATPEEIKKAYRTLVKKHHPDRFSRQDEAIQKSAEARFIEIQQAYEIVSD